MNEKYVKQTVVGVNNNLCVFIVNSPMCHIFRTLVIMTFQSLAVSECCLYAISLKHYSVSICLSILEMLCAVFFWLDIYFRHYGNIRKMWKRLKSLNNEVLHLQLLKNLVKFVWKVDARIRFTDKGIIASKLLAIISSSINLKNYKFENTSVLFFLIH